MDQQGLAEGKVMMREGKESFSERHGHHPLDAEITIREDAPQDFRYSMLAIAKEDCNLRPSTLRDIVCRTLRKRPNPNNWSEYPNVWDEVQGLVECCEWYRVYDVVEAIHSYLPKHPHMGAGAFEASVNDLFRELGIGWQLKEGLIQIRGDDAFETTLEKGAQTLGEKELPTAKSRLQEAIMDLSRRPNPDLPGAVTHALGALECVARETAGDPKSTLGEIMKRHPGLLPPPLDSVVEKCWGYSSENARHVREGQELHFEEAQLLVGLAAVMSTYLAQKFRE